MLRFFLDKIKYNNAVLLCTACIIGITSGSFISGFAFNSFDTLTLFHCSLTASSYLILVCIPFLLCFFCCKYFLNAVFIALALLKSFSIGVVGQKITQAFGHLSLFFYFPFLLTSLCVSFFLLYAWIVGAKYKRFNVKCYSGLFLICSIIWLICYWLC